MCSFYRSNFIWCLFLSLIINNTNGETIAAHKIQMFKFSQAFTFNDDRSIIENTWQEACIARHLQPVDLPNASYCINDLGNATYPQGVDICADGSIKIPMNFGWCNEIVSDCPNSTWELSADENTCFRPDDACWNDIENVPEEKLLAAIVYGESHWSNVYEEMAGIASAIIRKRDALHLDSINTLVKVKKHFSYVVYNKNERFVKLMCGEEKNFDKAYMAASNALNYGRDYSNGACYWDGYDLKTSGTKHDKYKAGFRYLEPEHNIFSTPEPPHVPIRGNKGYYDNVYISTAVQGKTIFWKLDEQFLHARGVRQCS
ncbi:Uncharacterised protein (plasmid) [Legionella adelaidensis]|uniref:Uncharacterized protein n=2 Tax=Legionella adelaidensis TaxID=45056 RepID=A0A0W0R1J9_9GAMM|nr:hypothetical protein Lade_1702 [Legionella adelaidensis]VEH86170.1 Uncharacterised protein [Legionella adelaidensis]